MAFWKKLFCKHKDYHWEWFVNGWRIKVCDNCGYEDFGFRNKRFKYKL